MRHGVKDGPLFGHALPGCPLDCVVRTARGVAAAVRCTASRAERELELWRKTVPMLKDELRAQGLKVGGKKAELVERLLGPGEIEDELDCDVPMAVTAMSPTVLIEACKS